MVASHAVLVFVTMVKTFSIKRLAWRSRMRTPLATLLLRDGILFLVLLVFNAFANFYANPKNSTTLFLVWPYFHEIIYVIILSHFILDVRGLSPAPTESSESNPTPNMPTLETPRAKDDVHSGITADRLVVELQRDGEPLHTINHVPHGSAAAVLTSEV
ncbi:hypothetical protein OH76DRAFT_1483714 [Lentinus brumalis]|uniref:Uncharacterized protein n=1 Tax=Lentinus brumalis TaxID=2498619 RepID=A0A371D7V3_9APHY|nr:hypothetical protein OH76DRAFT_1483714 [Polyporus brumalis]